MFSIFSLRLNPYFPFNDQMIDYVRPNTFESNQ